MNQIRQKIHPGLRGAIFYAIYWGVVGMFDPFFTVYFLRQGLNATQIGWLAAVLPLCTVIIAPLVSRLADATGRRIMLLVLACLGFGAALTLPVLPGFNPTFAVVLGFVALVAVFRSPTISLADSLVAQMALRHALDFGSMRLWGSIVFTITASGLGLLWERTGFSTMFLASGLAYLLVVLAALLLEEPPRRMLPSEPDNHPAPNSRFVLDAGLVFLLCATFLVIAALFMAGTFASVQLIQLGGSEALVGIMMGCAATGEVPGMMYGIRLARRIGPTNALLAAYGVVAFGLAATALAQAPWLMLVFAAFRGLGFGVLLVSTVMIINTRAPKNFASTYQGILNGACWGLAPLLGGPISGWIFQNLGPAALFFTAGIMALLAGVLITPTYRLWKTEKAGTMPASPEPAK
jgi:MFS transporter, PPP family, 3-phenylpropionic acid transporter